MSTQSFFHVGACWGVLEAITKRNTFNHVSNTEIKKCKYGQSKSNKLLNYNHAIDMNLFNILCNSNR